ncbi:heparin lyase I family protein [Streptoalloteichus hindustanus]|uniref:Polysaccharide lyase n=1 Tax=Streptoalloteichus hindustanus TaxID=2017 RepID=A0A1M5B4K0_STRHI|nr:heparin lyase I family protein [Streptoalloteichus hindustanus]SHF37423.1 Polysaccharide lyase [Streptoalloteichus hindustanus]
MTARSSGGLGRRALLTSALGGVVALPFLRAGVAGAAGPDSTDPLAAAASPWTLRWKPEPAEDGLDAFEGVEDDRKKSHPGVRHIYVQGNSYRFDMHTRDRDGEDRQRSEVKGMRVDDENLAMLRGETWRFTYSMFIPKSLRATRTFTHVMQMKKPGPGTSPILVMSLRQHSGVPKIEMKVFESDTLVGMTDLAPLQDKWIDTEFELRVGDGREGQVRWVVRDGGRTVLDERTTGVDLWLGDRVRPKWGIYRSVRDTTGALRDCHLLIRNLRAYQRK